MIHIVITIREIVAGFLEVGCSDRLGWGALTDRIIERDGDTWPALKAVGERWVDMIQLPEAFTAREGLQTPPH